MVPQWACVLFAHQVAHQPVNGRIVWPVMRPRQQANRLFARRAAEPRLSPPLRSRAGLEQFPDHLGRAPALGDGQRQQRPVLGAKLLAQSIELLVIGRFARPASASA